MSWDDKDADEKAMVGCFAGLLAILILYFVYHFDVIMDIFHIIFDLFEHIR